MNIRSKASIFFVTILCAHPAIATDACYGKISLLWVDTDKTVNFDIEPTKQCPCNFVEGSSKGFFIPRNQENREEQYSALLAAFMADKVISSWHDWTSNEGTTRCTSHNIALGKF